MGVCFVSMLPLAQAANEAAFARLWQQHQAKPDQHAELITACRSFASQNPSDTLIPVARSLETWHLLKAGRQKEALTILDKQLTQEGDAVEIGAATLARAWLSRLDLEELKPVLKAYYRKEVGYPESLNALRGHAALPADFNLRLTDRWGKPWRYRLAGFQSAPGFRNQRYTIGCSGLGDSSHLAVALARPYADGIQVRPLRTMGHQNAASIVEFGTWIEGKEKGERFHVSPGRTAQSVFLAHVGDHLILVCDRTHWKVFSKPR